MTNTRAEWQNWVNLILGAWLFITPFVFNTSPNLLSMNVNFYLVGLVVAVLSIAALSKLYIWEEGMNIIMGAWMFFSPWIFGYKSLNNLMVNSLIVGGVVAVVAALALPEARRSESTMSAI